MVCPSMPLRTYWPEAEQLSLTRKSPLQDSSACACLRPSLQPDTARDKGLGNAVISINLQLITVDLWSSNHLLMPFMFSNGHVNYGSDAYVD